jgi:hypothetical protein
LRLTDEGLEDHVVLVASLLERYGVELDVPGDLLIELAIDGTQTFDLRGTISLDPSSAQAIVEVRETWVLGESGGLERREYVYELIDHGRDFRRSFHLHDAAWFERRFLVVVHEHCERPIGAAGCGHYEGTPIRDAFAGVVALIDAWTADPPDCSEFRCLD